MACLSDIVPTRRMVRLACLVAVLILSPCSALHAGQKELLEKKVKELVELNKIVVGKSVDLEKYNNQTVFIKARLQQLSDNEYNVKVEEVSVEDIKSEGKKGDDASVVIKAMISEQPDKTFHLDLEHLLPPEKNDGDKKEKESPK